MGLPAHPPQPPGPGVAVEDLVVTHHDQVLVRPEKAAVHVPDAGLDLARQLLVVRLEQLQEAVALGRVLAVHPDVVFPGQPLQLAQCLGGVRLQSLDRADADLDGALVPPPARSARRRMSPAWAASPLP